MNHQTKPQQALRGREGGGERECLAASCELHLIVIKFVFCLLAPFYHDIEADKIIAIYSAGKHYL